MHGEARAWGAFRVDGMALALPVQALREAQAMPDLLALPCAAPCVIGGLELRGAVLPVLDLALLLGRSAPSGPRAQVLVLAHGGHRVALAVDAIEGTFTAAADNDNDNDSDSDSDSDQPLHEGTLRRDDLGTMVQRLSPGALLAQPGVPRVAELAGGQDRVAVPSRPLLLLRCGRLRLAIDALAVQTTLAAPALMPSALARGHCRGVIEHDARPVAAVDLHALLGFGEQPGAAAQTLPAVLLRLAEGPVALRVDRIEDVRSVRDDQRVPLSALGLPLPGLFEAALALGACSEGRQGGKVSSVGDSDDDGAPYLLIDAAALRADECLRALAGVHRHPAQAAAGAATTSAPTSATTSAPTSARVVCIELDGECAVPIEDLVEILAFPASFEALSDPQADGADGACGIVVSRGRSIPVLDLRRLAGLPPRPLAADARVLVVRAGAGHAGFAVPALKTIEPVRWTPPAHAARLSGADRRVAALGITRCVMLGEPDAERTVPVLALPALVARLQSSTPEQSLVD